MNRPLSRVKCFTFTVRLVSMGIAGLGAGQLRDRDGVSKGCVVRRGTELLFAPPAMSSSPPPLKYTRCHCWHKHHYTPSNHQLLFPSSSLPIAYARNHPPNFSGLFSMLLLFPSAKTPGDACNCLFSIPLPPHCIAAWAWLLCCPLPLFQCPRYCEKRPFPVELRVLLVPRMRYPFSSSPVGSRSGLPASARPRPLSPPLYPPPPPISYPFLGCSVSSLFVFLPPPGAFVGV